MKKLVICLASVIMVSLITGCGSNIEYYCKEGDELIGGNSCIHKSTYQATPVCNAGYPYNPVYRQCCWHAQNISCYTPREYKCNSGDILSGTTCYKEEFYEAYIKKN